LHCIQYVIIIANLNVVCAGLVLQGIIAMLMKMVNYTATCEPQ